MVFISSSCFTFPVSWLTHKSVFIIKCQGRVSPILKCGNSNISSFHRFTILCFTRYPAESHILDIPNAASASCLIVLKIFILINIENPLEQNNLDYYITFSINNIYSNYKLTYWSPISIYDCNRYKMYGNISFGECFIKNIHFYSFQWQNTTFYFQMSERYC